MIIDAHAHVFPAAAVRARDSRRAWYDMEFRTSDNNVTTLRAGESVMSWGPKFWEPPQQRLLSMNTRRIDMEILSLTGLLFRYDLDSATGVRMAREVNNEIVAMVEGAPERFLGLATLPLQSPRAAIAELERVMAIPGMVGAAVGTHVNEHEWDSPSLLPVLRAAEESGAFLLLHPTGRSWGSTVLGKFPNLLVDNPLQVYLAIASLIFGGVMDRLPGLRICVAHAGGFAPISAGRLDHDYLRRSPAARRPEDLPSAYLRRLYYDSLAYSVEALQLLIDVVGVDRVVLGSDYPAATGIDDPVQWVTDNRQLTTSQKRAVLGGSVAAALRLPRSGLTSPQ